jgi:hypothetical protein
MQSTSTDCHAPLRSRHCEALRGTWQSNLTSYALSLRGVARHVAKQSQFVCSYHQQIATLHFVTLAMTVTRSIPVIARHEAISIRMHCHCEERGNLISHAVNINRLPRSTSFPSLRGTKQSHVVCTVIARNAAISSRRHNYLIFFGYERDARTSRGFVYPSNGLLISVSNSFEFIFG